MSRPDTTISPEVAETLEVAPGAEHEQLEGWIPSLATEEEIRQALEKAFKYRGDVTITRRNGDRVECYIFDRRSSATLADSVVRVIPKDSTERVSVPYSDIAGLSFSGRDTAAGKSWGAWIRKYWEKKMAGENNISLEPEALD